MDQGRPVVSIGLATYNGGRFLAQSVDSLLDQDYPNWELLISDNCSTDDTETIARGYAARSDRIRYVRQGVNLGATPNFNYVLEQARGTYFMWAADHDLWEPDFVSRCVEALEADPSAVLACSACLLIDQAGKPIEEVDDHIDFDRPSALYRYKHMLWPHVASKIYGLFRREALVATGGFPDVLSPDRLVLLELALRGPFKKLDGLLFKSRLNREPHTVESYRRHTIEDLDPAKASVRSATPAPRLYSELRDLCLKAVEGSSLPFGEKLDARLATLYAFHMKYHVASNRVRLLRMVAKATRQMARLDRWSGRVA
jgi:glycosyltransferase involved in cell wall biosynthesis